jgi:hypothetical protein
VRCAGLLQPYRPMLAFGTQPDRFLEIIPVLMLRPPRCHRREPRCASATSRLSVLGSDLKINPRVLLQQAWRLGMTSTDVCICATPSSRSAAGTAWSGGREHVSWNAGLGHHPGGTQRWTCVQRDRGDEVRHGE